MTDLNIVTICGSLRKGSYNHALLRALPALAPALLGRELRLPNVATWWLGDPAVREAVMQNLDDLVIAPAFSGDLPPHIDQQVVIGKNLDADARARVVESIGRRDKAAP